MKNQFKFPANITDPEKITDCLTDDQVNALTDYMTQGMIEYYQGTMKELARVEAELAHAKAIIKQDRQIISNLLQRFPVVKLTGGIDFNSGLN